MDHNATPSVIEGPLEFRDVEISREPIELYKILKFESMVGSGGEAKAAVAAGQVLLNGNVETQKRKKIMAGDTIEFGEEKIRIQLSPTIGHENHETPGTAT
ncbi:MAG: RNA-binding S4 domain-containing protein [Nitrospirae bacterium]|nr:RNA-binding S4 domain-containing protein [Nitrospirota bacterium]MDA1303081.1 RNA-binding S4 domain-containing protein [Nitrospirota bacterium]